MSVVSLDDEQAHSLATALERLAAAGMAQIEQIRDTMNAFDPIVRYLLGRPGVPSEVLNAIEAVLHKITESAESNLAMANAQYEAAALLYSAIQEGPLHEALAKILDQEPPS